MCARTKVLISLCCNLTVLQGTLSDKVGILLNTKASLILLLKLEPPTVSTSGWPGYESNVCPLGPLIEGTHSQLQECEARSVKELTVYSCNSVQRHPLHKLFYKAGCFHKLDVNKE